jgi:hypothetical protein
MPAIASPSTRPYPAVPRDAADDPDPSYWTAYDHFMVEREARALRRAYTWGLLARAWRALLRRPGRPGTIGQASYLNESWTRAR